MRETIRLDARLRRPSAGVGRGTQTHSPEGTVCGSSLDDPMRCRVNDSRASTNRAAIRSRSRGPRRRPSEIGLDHGGVLRDLRGRPEADRAPGGVFHPSGGSGSLAALSQQQGASMSTQGEPSAIATVEPLRLPLSASNSPTEMRKLATSEVLTVTCPGCAQPFASAIQMDAETWIDIRMPSGMLERCPGCGRASRFAKGDYRFEAD
jgi:hypothetical protein